jgi:hypothetical protein
MSKEAILAYLRIISAIENENWEIGTVLEILLMSFDSYLYDHGTLDEIKLFSGILNEFWAILEKSENK